MDDKPRWGEVKTLVTPTEVKVIYVSPEDSQDLGRILTFARHLDEVAVSLEDMVDSWDGCDDW